jgi:hypothetical protein
MEAGTQYCSAPGADMDRRIVIDIFFVSTDAWFAEIIHKRGSQRNFICNHYLWEYPGVISHILSKEKIRVVRHISSVLFNINRNVKGLCRRYSLRVFSFDKTSPG